MGSGAFSSTNRMLTFTMLLLKLAVLDWSISASTKCKSRQKETSGWKEHFSFWVLLRIWTWPERLPIPVSYFLNPNLAFKIVFWRGHSIGSDSQDMKLRIMAVSKLWSNFCFVICRISELGEVGNFKMVWKFILKERLIHFVHDICLEKRSWAELVPWNKLL